MSLKKSTLVSCWGEGGWTRWSSTKPVQYNWELVVLNGRGLAKHATTQHCRQNEI